MITIQECVTALDGCEYRREGSKELWKQMKEARLVAVFGGSDDLVYLAGACDDEKGASTIAFTRDGVLENRCDDEECPYFEKLWNAASKLTPVWGKEGWSWTYRTSIPVETFRVLEDGDQYCRGVIFSLDDLPV